MSERAQKILDYLRSQKKPEIWIRQQTLAEEFKCSRRTIGRALKELKEASLLTDLNKRHENRCKVYCLEAVISALSRDPEIPHQVRDDKILTPEAQRQWECYSKTFGIVFRMFDGKNGRPALKECFTEIASELREIKDESELYSKIFSGLWALPNLKETDMSWRSEPENRNAGGTRY